jgi:Phosphoserine phosphatase RsbU, N-terminal domain
VSSGPGAEARPFGVAYTAALRDYLLDRSEAALRTAYELGRDAVRRRLSVLELAVAHQEALVAALGGARDGTEAGQVADAAGDFFLESLAAFEMVQRGLQDAQRAVMAERRQIELSRQLSTFLADASLALDASESLEEVLRLVVEQARELVGSECCVATVAADGLPRSAEVSSYPESDRRWTPFVQWLDRVAIYRFLRLSGGSVRMGDAELASLPWFRAAVETRPLRGWLAVSLTALDGTDLGAVQLFDKQDGAFSAEDEAALVHLTQMASAAVERAGLYRRPG